MADVLPWCCPGGRIRLTRQGDQFPAPGSADNVSTRGVYCATGGVILDANILYRLIYFTADPGPDREQVWRSLGSGPPTPWRGAA
jgi:hypothetical protein